MRGVPTFYNQRTDNLPLSAHHSFFCSSKRPDHNNNACREITAFGLLSPAKLGSANYRLAAKTQPSRGANLCGCLKMADSDRFCVPTREFLRLDQEHWNSVSAATINSALWLLAAWGVVLSGLGLLGESFRRTDPLASPPTAEIADLTFLSRCARRSGQPATGRGPSLREALPACLPRTCCHGHTRHL